MAKVVNMLFGLEGEEVLSDFYEWVSSIPETVEPTNSETNDALIESYKNAESWQIKRQILSVLAVSKTFQEIQECFPGITKFRYILCKQIFHMKT